MNSSGKKILIVGASSDLALAYIRCHFSDFDLIDGILRNKNTIPVSALKYFNDLIELDLNKLEDVERVNFNERYNCVIFFQGVDVIKPLSYTSYTDVIESFNVNIISSILLLRNMLKKKVIIKDSSLIIISSVSGAKIGNIGHVLYSASKAGISGLVRSLSLELAPRRIRLNSICPGLIRTEKLFRKNLNKMSDIEIKQYEKLYPLGFGNENSLNGIINFLFSQKSDWLTGQNIVLDGGHSIS